MAEEDVRLTTRVGTNIQTPYPKDSIYRQYFACSLRRGEDEMKNQIYRQDIEIEKHFEYIAHLISNSKHRVYRKVNYELIDLYGEIGRYISNQVSSQGWGKSVVKELSEYLLRHQANLRGFSPQNLWRMKQFYEIYKDNEKLSTLSREIPWSHNMAIIASANSDSEREFYINLVVNENLSFRDLKRQIGSSFYERAMLGNQKLSTLSREIPQDISNVFKDTYVLEMLQLPQSHSENDLKKQITRNISQFLLEFGRDFSFMGEEYPLQVGKQDFAVDLLFYHRSLQCLVALELKIENFKPAHLGQLNFYLEALDRDVKKRTRKPEYRNSSL
jgi:predicted nuclease of restriction endonuclease-like (RecB) superfamily